MKIINTKIEGLVVLEPNVFGDERGYFLESFKKEWFNEHFPGIEFIQDNESLSQRGVLRGLHFQKPPCAQTKLVRVIQGEVLDVAVDLRKKSPTYGEHVSIILSSENKRQFLIPKGFAHGFVVLSDTAIFSYKVDNPYSPSDEDGIIWNDPSLGIDWQIQPNEVSLSEKDKHLRDFLSLITSFE
jgi:dTDP-4-dehydrorhamnose 3,5-epimerase